MHDVNGARANQNTCSSCAIKLSRNEPHHQEDHKKISNFTKFGYVSLHTNQAVTCQRSPKFHTNVSNRPFSKMAAENSNTGVS